MSLIINLKIINDTYTIYDIGGHSDVTRNLVKKYKSFGIKELNYVPFIIDSGDSKFIYVRQKYSNNYNGTINIMKIKKLYNIIKKIKKDILSKLYICLFLLLFLYSRILVYVL